MRQPYLVRERRETLMSLSDAKIKVIRDFVAMMQQAQNAKEGNGQASAAQLAVYAAMTAISSQDLAEFNAQFPETPIGVSGI